MGCSVINHLIWDTDCCQPICCNHSSALRVGQDSASRRSMLSTYSIWLIQMVSSWMVYFKVFQNCVGTYRISSWMIWYIYIYISKPLVLLERSVVSSDDSCSTPIHRHQCTWGHLNNFESHLTAILVNLYPTLSSWQQAQSMIVQVINGDLMVI